MGGRVGWLASWLVGGVKSLVSILIRKLSFKFPTMENLKIPETQNGEGWTSQQIEVVSNGQFHLFKQIPEANGPS